MGYSIARCMLCRASLTAGRLRARGRPPYEAWTEDILNRRDDLDGSDQTSFCDKAAGCLAVIRFKDDTEPLVLSSDDLHRIGTFSYGNEFEMLPVMAFVPPGHDTDNVLCVEHLSGPRCQGSDRSGYSGTAITTEELRGCHSFVCIMEKDASWKAWEDDVPFEVDGNFFLSGLINDMEEREVCESKPRIDRHVSWEDTTVDDIPFDVLNGETDGIFKYVPPIHLACMELFCHISSRRLGRVDLGALWRWWRKHGSADWEDEFDVWDVAVLQANEQWWLHKGGQEFFIANPCQVPGWQQFLRSCVVEADKPYDERSSAFEPLGEGTAPPDLFSKLPFSLKHELLELLPSKDIASLRHASRAFHEIPQTMFRRFVHDEMPWLWETWASQGHLDSVRKLRDRSNPLTSRKPDTIRLIVKRVLWTLLRAERINRAKRAGEEVSVVSGPDDEETTFDDGDEGWARQPIRNSPPAESENPWHDYVCDHTGLWNAVFDKYRQGTTDLEELVAWAVDFLWREAGGAEDESALPPGRIDWCKLYNGARKMRRECNGIKNRAYIWSNLETVCRLIAKNEEEIAADQNKTASQS